MDMESLTKMSLTLKSHQFLSRIKGVLKGFQHFVPAHRFTLVVYLKYLMAFGHFFYTLEEFFHTNSWVF